MTKRNRPGVDQNRGIVVRDDKVVNISSSNEMLFVEEKVIPMNKIIVIDEIVPVMT